MAMNRYRLPKKVLFIAGLISMAMPMVNLVVLLFVALHHTIVVAKFDAQIPSNQLPGYLYTVALCLGMVGTLVLLRNHVGRRLGPALLWIARICLLTGFMAVAVGLPPGNWLRKVEVLDFFSVIFPLMFMAYLAFASYFPTQSHQLSRETASTEREAQQALAADARKASRA